MFGSCRQILTGLLEEEETVNANLLGRFVAIFDCGLNENKCEHARVCREFLKSNMQVVKPVEDRKTEPHKNPVCISKPGTSNPG